MEFLYDAIQYYTIMHTSLSEVIDDEYTSGLSPSLVNYGVSIFRVLEKIGRVITASMSRWYDVLNPCTNVFAFFIISR